MAAPAMAICALTALAGCAGMDDSVMSVAFADPAKYENFDCKQLEAEQKNLTNRVAELQGLMQKARTGVGGAVVAEVAYRNDYIAARSALDLAKKTWREHHCTDPGALNPQGGTIGPGAVSAAPAPAR